MPNVHVAFKPNILNNTFGEYLSKNNMHLFKIVEKAEAYDLKPELSIKQVTKQVIESIESKKYESIVLNYVSPDMIGHTGNLETTIKALEVIDECIGTIAEKIQEVDGVLLITANHGNIEQMIDYVTGDPHTAHTTNDVPLVILGIENITLKSGRLCDIAPTMLDIMKLTKPDEMTGESLIIC